MLICYLVLCEWSNFLFGKPNTPLRSTCIWNVVVERHWKLKKIIFCHRRIVIDIICLSKFQYHLNNNMAVSFSGERDRITRSKTTDIPLVFSLSLNLYYIILYYIMIFMHIYESITMFYLVYTMRSDWTFY